MMISELGIEHVGTLLRSKKVFVFVLTVCLVSKALMQQLM